jgi:hypothetical protein
MWTNLLVELTGSFVGAGLGLCVAMWYDRWKQRQEMEHRRQVAITTLLEEMKRTLLTVGIKGLEALEKPDPKQPFEIELSYPYLLDAAFTATIYSGSLAMLPSKLQTDLSQYYRQLDFANALVKRLVLLAPELDAANLGVYRNISTHLKGSTDMLKMLGDDIVETLQRLRTDHESGTNSPEEFACT